MASELAQAARRFEVRFPHIKLYELRGLGNVLRHAYGAVDPVRVWELVTGSDLTELREALGRYRPLG